MKRISLKVTVNFLFGLLGGVLICNFVSNHRSVRCLTSDSIYPEIRHSDLIGLRHGKIPHRSNIYLGMMSAAKFLTTRVQRNVDTWLQKGGWKIEVFADAEPSLNIPAGMDINIVTLPTVDDTAYPPQKKSFLLLRHMHDYHINDYEWFIRADDDAYFDFPRLETLLNTLNSSQSIFLGNPGFGMDEDDGIEEGMKYLMGGLGMIFSRGLLREIRPHLKHCIQHLFSPHEDIEIGRCVWKHTKAITPVAWETIDLFYQQYDKETGAVIDIILDQLTPVRTAKTITYHSVKTSELMYRLHNQVLRRELSNMLNRTARLRNQIDHMRKIINVHEAHGSSDLNLMLPLLMGDAGKASWLQNGNSWPDDTPWHAQNASISRISSTIPWMYWDIYYRNDLTSELVPVRGHSKVEKNMIKTLLADIEGSLLHQACPNFPPNVHFNYGYLQHGTLEGVKVVTVHRSTAGSTIKYCRTVSQMTYAVTMFGEDSPLKNHKKMKAVIESQQGIHDFFGVRDNPVLNGPAGAGARHKYQAAVPLQNSFSTFPSRSSKIIITIPLQGRYRALEQFMDNYEKNFLKPALHTSVFDRDIQYNVQLAIVLLGNDEQGDDLGLNRAAAHLLRSYQMTYGLQLVHYHMASTGDRSFSRGAGLQLGSLIGEEGDILFFMDIDMVVTPNLLAQCRRNVKRGEKAWYPSPYSQYDPDKLCYNDEVAKDINRIGNVDLVYAGGGGPVFKEDISEERLQIRNAIKQTPLTLSTERGFWRDFGFGITCLYKSDFLATGGFDLTIEGWGEEDIRLFLSLIKSGLDVFRARQVDLIHIFHNKYCDQDISEEQRQACLRTKASHYASQKCLAKTWYLKQALKAKS